MIKTLPFKKIPTQLWFLGISDALLNISAAIIFTVSGPFMRDVLRSNPMAIGTLEGIVELVSWNVRLVSGVMSDFFKNRKTIMIIGYSVVILSRPVLALAMNIYMVLIGRSLDRLGKGIQAAPREALVADISPIDLRGACFGFRHALGISGSMIGAYLVYCMMEVMTYNYRLMLWLSAIPALLALVFLFVNVREVKVSEKKSQKITLKSKDILALGKGYWTIILVSLLFMLCRSSEVFIVLRAIDFGMAVDLIPFIMIIYNFSETLISYPLGKISDQVGRPLCIAIAIVLLSLANFLIACAKTKETIFLAAIFWGMQRGIGHSVFLSWVADRALAHLRGTAYGAFYLISGVFLFLANVISGVIIHYVSYEILFLSRAALGILPFLSVIIMLKRQGK